MEGWFLAFFPSHASADPNVLKGLTGVAVEILQLSPSVKEHGGSPARLQTDVELRLRTAGIKVFASSEADRNAGRPTLRVFVMARPLESSDQTEILAFAKFLFIELHEVAELSKDRSSNISIRNATTWRTSFRTGLSKPGALATDIRKNVADLVDEFLNAYLGANQK